MPLCTLCISKWRVLPAVERVDVCALGEEALGDFLPSVERGDVERRAAVVVAGADERAVLVEQLAHGGRVVLVRVPEDERRARHQGLVVEPPARVALAAYLIDRRR